MLKDAELDGVKDTLNDVRNLDPTKAIKDKLNPLKSELDDVKKSVEQSTDFDPVELFDESKAPQAPEPVTVDVDAALERQRERDAQTAKIPPSSGVNAVPGFGGPKAPAAAVEKPAKKKAARKQPAARKSASTPKTTGKVAAKTKTTAKAAGKKPAAPRKTKTAKKAEA